MPNQTKEVIIRALVELLAEKPVERVTVRDIVERCGVNRNTFYYHFQDIPDAMDYAMRRELRRIIDEDPASGTVTEALLAVLQYLEDHRKQMLHIYRSVRRETFIRFVQDMIAYVIDRLGEHLDEEMTIGEKDLEAVKYLLRCAIFGILLDWMESGMKYDIRQRVEDLRGLLGEEIAWIR